MQNKKKFVIQNWKLPEFEQGEAEEREEIEERKGAEKRRSQKSHVRQMTTNVRKHNMHFLDNLFQQNVEKNKTFVVKKHDKSFVVWCLRTLLFSERDWAQERV